MTSFAGIGTTGAQLNLEQQQHAFVTDVTSASSVVVRRDDTAS